METFEEIVKQNERRCQYHIERLRVNDQRIAFKCKGFHTLRHAYKVYQPNKGMLSTYFNIIIRDRMTRLLRDKTVQHHDTRIKKEVNQFYLDYSFRDDARVMSGER